MALKLQPTGVDQQAEMIRAVSMVLSTRQIGEWSSDHGQEAKSYSGWNYIAIAAIGRIAARSTGYVYSTADEKVSTHRKSLQSQYGSIWKSFADDGVAEVVEPSHWVSKLLAQPNPTQSLELFLWEYIQQMHLHGCCIIFDRPTADYERISQRYIVPMALTMPVQPGMDKRAPNGGIRILTYAAGMGFMVHPMIRSLSGAVVPIEMLSIVRYPHPVLRGDGKSPSDVAGWWIDTAQMVDMSRWKQLKRGPRPHGVVTVEGAELTPQYLDEVETRLNQKLGDEGYDNRVLVVGNGTNLNADTSPVEMDYTNAFDQMGSAVLATHGVGRIVAGLSDGGSFGALAAGLQQSASVVQSDLDLLGGDWTTMARSHGALVEVQFVVPTYDDPAMVEQQLQTDLNAGIRTMREWRSMRGLKPFGDWRDDARVTPQGLVLDTQPPQQPGAGAAGPGGMLGAPPQAAIDPSLMQSAEHQDGMAAFKLPGVQETPKLGLSALMDKDSGEGSLAKAWRSEHFVWDKGPGRKPIVAIDLDGTLARQMPDFDPDVIGSPIDNNVRIAQQLKQAGCMIVIFTCRDNDELVKEWCFDNEVPDRPCRSR